MQLPLSWLKTFFPHDISTTQLAETLTATGIEVDLVEPYLPPFTGVFSALVEEVSKHPDADKLQVAKVFDGHTHYTVVCGAPNCRKGIRVAFAKPGAILGKEKPLEIHERAVRGVHSQGMLCSLYELGLVKEEEPGILELEESFPLGVNLHNLLSDEILHLSVTPNLGHTLSVVGVARELSAFLKLPYTIPNLETESSKELKGLNCKVESPDCKAYFVHKIGGLRNLKTPFLIQHKLRLAGYSPKNLACDILNYVMMERGIPMHAFDATKLHHDSLEVKNLSGAQPFHALNGKTYTLPKDTLVIESGHKPVAIAGVIGSEDSATSEITHGLLVEAAYFTPSSVRKSIKNLDLRTEACNRFEKGVDAGAIANALSYASALIVSLSGGHVEGHFKYQIPIAPKLIKLSVEKTNRLLGTHLTSDEMSSMLKLLEMTIQSQQGDALTVSCPTYRNDLNIEEDLIEEVGRLYGLDHLKGSLQYHATSIMDHPLYTFEKPLKKAFFAQGLQEILTCDLLSYDLASDFKLEKDRHLECIRVLHPRSMDQCALRMSLLSSFIPVIKKNLSVKEKNLHLFEVGKTHCKDKDHYLETLQAGFVLTGDRQPYHFESKARKVDFYDLKGMAESLLKDLGVENYTFATSHDLTFHPYQQLSILSGNQLIGKLGQVHPKLLKKYDIDQKIFYAEFSVAELLVHRKSIYPVTLPPTQPFTERDWTVKLEEKQSYKDLESLCKSTMPTCCESLVLLDIYPQENGKHFTLRFRYRDQDKSLESHQVDQMHQNFIETVAKKLSQTV